MSKFQRIARLYSETGLTPRQAGRVFKESLSLDKLIKNSIKLAPPDAVKYLKDKKIETSTTGDVDHNRVFTVKGLMKADLLQHIHDEVTKAIDSGTTLEDFKKSVGPRLEEAGWTGNTPSRLKTIFATNIQSAYAAGRRNRQEQVSASRPWWRYVSVIDKRTSEICRKLDGFVARNDDPIWDKYYVPNHYSCRATVQTLSDRQVSKLNLKLPMPAPEIHHDEAKQAAKFDVKNAIEPDLSKYTPAIRDAVSAELQKTPEPPKVEPKPINRIAQVDPTDPEVEKVLGFKPSQSLDAVTGKSLYLAMVEIGVELSYVNLKHRAKSDDSMRRLLRRVDELARTIRSQG